MTKISDLKKVLIIRTDRLGDAILSTPVATAIKECHPQAEVCMLVNSGIADIIRVHLDIDDIIVDDLTYESSKPKGLFQLSEELRARNFDAAIVLHPTFRLTAALFLARIPWRVGTGFRWYSFLFNKRHFEHRKDSQKHELDYNLNLAASIGARLNRVEFRFQIPRAVQNKISQFLVERDLRNGHPNIIIHPGSGGSARDWRPECFGQLAQQLINTLGANVFITGSKNEKHLEQTILRLTQNQPIPMTGKLSLLELGALMQEADLFISNSTGPLHLAVALGMPVIGLYCPIRTCRPERWGPYGQSKNVIMSQKEDCNKCLNQKPRYCSCMDNITVEQVYQKVEQNLYSFEKVIKH
jgi:heptosyltransferase-2